jgi:hypothetical protein
MPLLPTAQTQPPQNNANFARSTILLFKMNGRRTIVTKKAQAVKMFL